ncbi:hypothetical protein BaRGS_00038446 [Batillaria attramentaria]|uniref:Lipoprotein n=1 Tax=Batillaria attramentaria TaxID=370345 RepID=A0ABD0J7A2_9CAEN
MGGCASSEGAEASITAVNTSVAEIDKPDLTTVTYSGLKDVTGLKWEFKWVLDKDGNATGTLCIGSKCFQWKNKVPATTYKRLGKVTTSKSKKKGLFFVDIKKPADVSLKWYVTNTGEQPT